MLATLVANSNDHHSCAPRRRESANISKIQVQCYDDARFGNSVLRKQRIVTATEPFVVNCFCVVTRFDE
jgi:hypothetical protein